MKVPSDRRPSTLHAVHLHPSTPDNTCTNLAKKSNSHLL